MKTITHKIKKGEPITDDRVIDLLSAGWSIVDIHAIETHDGRVIVTVFLFPPAGDRRRSPAFLPSSFVEKT